MSNDGARMGSNCFAGLDVSTQSCKILLLDSSGVIYVDSVNFDEDLTYGTRLGVRQDAPSGVSESDPLMWIEAVNQLFKRLQESGIPVGNIRCLSVSGQQHGLVALSKEGDLSRPYSKLWNDFSTDEECRLLTESVGGLKGMIEAVSNSQRTGYTASKILHMARNEKEAFHRTEIFLLVHNYINWYLTGGKEGGVAVMEPGDTSGTALWNPATGQWADGLINFIDPALKKKLPPVKPSDEPIGRISRKLCERYGFSPECLIDAGCGDNMYGAVGTGNVEPGIITISLGTSGTVYTVMETPFSDPTGEIASFCDSTGKYLPLLCVSNMANGYEAALDMYGIDHMQFDELISETEPGNGGKLLIPWFTGERTPDIPHAAPLWFGYQTESFTQPAICRGLLEGHVLNLYEGFARMKTRCREIRLTGGLSRSPSWCQAIADIFDAETVPVKGEGAALGAAIHARWVWQKQSGNPIDLNVLAGVVDFDDANRKKPAEKYRHIREKQKRLFHALSERIQGREGEDPFFLRAELT